MDVDALKTAALVAQHGSFTAAARVIDVDASTVSRTVASVENKIGLRLFQRNARSLTLTEEGAAYLSRVGPLLLELDHAADEARQLRELPSGTLRMTASVAFAYEVIVPHLAAFRDLYPKIIVELLPTDATVDILAEKIDLAIRLASAPEGDVISTKLMSTRYRVCASPDYLDRTGAIDHPTDLQTHDCLRFALPEFRSTWKFRRGTDDIAVPVGGTLLISNALGLRRAARDGLGPVLLGDWLVKDDLAQGRLVDLFPDWECSATTFDTGAWALYPSREFLPRKVRAMIDFLKPRLRTAGR
ncbi:LysR family transcriptional regulator [Marivita hallyeonensis]|uniref:Transcriptional regulator, LysR family n=1 Tax=Marivita hallyeonensis TaxID=996342 RepID=A0A1M5SDB6_9RHOB|nr:LysR family transcriptional regulator [Marivita hallyeonensis]SHH36288.1 transcriptional regulator, LysR family [Marivita hallyeonensis]